MDHVRKYSVMMSTRTRRFVSAEVNAESLNDLAAILGHATIADWEASIRAYRGAGCIHEIRGEKTYKVVDFNAFPQAPQSIRRRPRNKDEITTQPVS